jgi:hypothetical protein
MNRPHTAGSAAVSQFQLIGGIRHEAGDCVVAVEPGGAVQQRKGALYLVTEPAGDLAVGGEACSLVGATLAHEYYADASPSITTSLAQALNKANTGLVQYNRQVFAANDPPAGLPRKIRVGLSAAIVRPGQLYICQLKPGLILWVHQGTVVAFPRPVAWTPQALMPNGDGEIVGNFYAAPALGTGAVVEADFAFRRFDAGDLLILCSSNLAPLLNEDALAGALPGRAGADVVEYFHALAQDAGLPEAHALVVEMAAAAVIRRGTGAVTLPPPPDWAPEAAAPPMPATPRSNTLQTAPLPEEDAETDSPVIPVEGTDRRVLQLRPRGRGASPGTYSGEPMQQTFAPGNRDAEAVPLDPGEEAEAGAEYDAADDPPPVALPARPNGARVALTNVLNRARQAGQRAAPVVGSMGKATLDAAGTAGKATLGAAGTAGKATLGAAGNVLGATLPENVRQRGAAGILNPDGVLIEEEIDDESDDFEDEEADDADLENGQGVGTSQARGGIVDFDAPGQTTPPPSPPFPLVRWLIPIAVVVLLGVLVFAVQQILSGQQTARVDTYLAQAQQEETDGHTGTTAERRQHLMSALDLAQKATDIDARSNSAQRLASQIQSELDDLNGVTRLAGLKLLFDFGTKGPSPAATALPPTSDPTGLGGAVTTTETATLAPILTAPQGGDYLSQVVVHGDDAFLLDRGSGTLYRYVISTSQYTTLLAPGQEVDEVGTVGDKARVGTLLLLTWRPTAEGGDLAVIDDAHVAYIWTPGAAAETGQWQAFALGGADKLDRPRDLGAYDGNLYLLLAKPGQISKWAAGAYNDDSVDWLSDAASTEIRNRAPVAMAIDGQIYLLLGDGRIITLSAGEIKNTLAPTVWPPVASALAIFTDESSNSLYVVEAADKRIIRLDKASGAVQGQLKAPADTTAFDGLRNVYVDEAANKIYILSAKKLYVATLPALPAAAGTPGPDPTPTAAP